MATSNKLISVQHLVKEYNHGTVKALNDCSIDIARGEVVAIIGPSGSGKSTLLRSLNLLEQPTSGEILFDGVNLADKSVDINLHRQKMGMVFQHFNLFPHKTVLQNITMAPITLKKKTPEQAQQQAEELLKRIGLADKANEYPNMLSGGQKQRIAIVRALAMDPEVMLFDAAADLRQPEGSPPAGLPEQGAVKIQFPEGHCPSGNIFCMIPHDEKRFVTIKKFYCDKKYGKE